MLVELIYAETFSTCSLISVSVFFSVENTVGIEQKMLSEFLNSHLQAVCLNNIPRPNILLNADSVGVTYYFPNFEVDR